MLKSQKYFFVFFLIMQGVIIYAQPFKISGKVVDVKGNSLAMANIITYDTLLKKIITYTTSDHLGNYSLIYPKANLHCQLRASYLGYENFITSIPTNVSENYTLDIIMKPRMEKLDAVDIVYKVPISSKGDTITYDPKAFTSGNEDKLGELLKKLPGVEVNEDGDVTVEGKKVSKIMLENKDFFDGDTKLATQNIPADAIDKVQVMKKFNDVDAMRGLNFDDENTVINLKLKEGEKRFWFGDIKAGGGHEEKYVVNPKLFYYSPKLSSSIIGNLNNTGEQPFTLRDYINFSGGIQNLFSNSSGLVTIDPSSLGLSFLRNDKAKTIQTQFSAINVSYHPDKKTTINSYAIFNKMESDLESKTQKSYLISNIRENVNSTSEIKEAISLLRLSVKRKHNLKAQTHYNFFAKKGKQQTDGDILSNLYQKIMHTKNSSFFDLSQDINIYRNIASKHVLNLSLQQNYKEQAFDIDYFNPDTLQSFLPVIHDPGGLQINQNQSVSKNSLAGALNYYFLATGQVNVNLSIGGDNSHDVLRSNTTQQIGTDTYNFSDTSLLVNFINYHLSNIYSSLTYKHLIGKVTIMPGIKIQRSIMRVSQKSQTNDFTRRFILPSFGMRYKLKNSEELFFMYNTSTAFPAIQKLSESYSISSYNTYRFGNNALKNTLYHNINLTYYNFNLFSYSNYRALVGYSKKKGSIITTSSVVNNKMLYKYLNYNEPEETWFGEINYEKRFIMLGLKGHANVNLYTFATFIDENPYKSENLNHAYRLSIASYLKKLPNIEVGSELGFNDFTYASFNDKYQTNRYFVQLELPIFKSFVLKSTYNYYENKNSMSSTVKTYSFLDAKLIMKTKTSRWNFFINARNILNTRSLHEEYKDTFFISSSDYLVMRRSLVFSIIYKL